MNNILTLANLETIIAERTGRSATEVRLFLKELFAEAAESLAGGAREVEIPGIGHFTVAEDEDIPVKYNPAKDLDKALNEPFSMFEPVELSDGISADDLAIADSETEVLEEIPSATEDGADTEPTDIQETKEEDHSLDTFPEAIIEEEPAKVEIDTTPTPVPAEQTPEMEVKEQIPTPHHYDYPEYEKETERRFNPVLAYILGIVTGIIISCVAVYFIYPKLMDDSFESLYADDEPYIETDIEAVETADETHSEPVTQEPQEAASPATPSPMTEPEEKPTESTAEAAPAPQPTAGPVYDTVRPGYFLAKMAKKHYGVEEFWVYIYEENKAKIKNPNQLSNGFKVVIPPAEKYGIDAKNPASVEKAKNRSHELNRKFK